MVAWGSKKKRDEAAEEAAKIFDEIDRAITGLSMADTERLILKSIKGSLLSMSKTGLLIRAATKRYDSEDLMYVDNRMDLITTVGMLILKRLRPEGFTDDMINTSGIGDMVAVAARFDVILTKFLADEIGGRDD